MSGRFAPYTIIPLSVTEVATGGVAVTPLAAGSCRCGGFIHNPSTATADLGVNQIDTASGTTSQGNTSFIAPGQTYNLAPTTNAVSVISSVSGHQFSGEGFV